MPTFDRDELNEILKSDIRNCMKAFRSIRPNETFYAFVLYTDGDAITVSAYANTLERFAKASKNNPDASWTKWAPDEWEYLDEDNFMAASQEIVGDYEGFEGDEFDQRKQHIFGAFSMALSQLREEGVFDSQIALYVNISDAADEELQVMQAIIRQINPQPLAKVLSAAIVGD